MAAEQKTKPSLPPAVAPPPAPLGVAAVTSKKTSLKTKKKKRKRSKHVLEAEAARKKTKGTENQLERSANNNDNLGTIVSENVPSSPKKVGRKRKHKTVKDPAEAALYLTRWKADRDAKESDNKANNRNNSGWKFNKNTQSWLIRHMYEADKLSKSTFSLLLEYLHGMPSNSQGRERIMAEAVRRAVRYQDYEKSKMNNPKDDRVKEKADNEKEAKKTNSQGVANDSTNEQADDDEAERIEEADRWSKLDDHGKRKEYKRARKVLETLKA